MNLFIDKFTRKPLISFLLVSLISPWCVANTTEKMAELSQLIEKVAAKNVDVERERMTLHSAKLFQDWIKWDEQNVDINTKFYNAHPWYKKDAKQHAQNLAPYERVSVEQMLDDAIAEITLLDQQKIVRKPVPKLDYNNIQFKNNQLVMNDQPVFTSDYTWMPSTPELTQYYGNLSGYFLAPSFLENAEGDISKNALKKFNDTLTGDNSQAIGHTFISHNALPKWALKKYPELKDGARHYTAYDIDHPVAKSLYRDLFNYFIPKIKDSRGTELGYMLMNEPSFHTQKQNWNSGGVSANTIAKFQTWLAQQHQSIASLNSLWQTNFASFADITIDIPIDSKLRGSAMWFDWCRFNQIRVSQWFAFLRDEIKKHDSDAKTHIKLIPRLWYENSRDQGLDYEQLLMQSDMIGFDAKSNYSSVRKKKDAWEKSYAFDWQGPAMSFDFFSSVQPQQLLYDTENHFFTSVRFMEKDINLDYLQSVYWLGFSHGLSSTATWVWGRNEDGSIIQKRGVNEEFIVDVTHQPKGLNTLTRTLMDLNANASDVISLQKQAKPVRLFYSETSAINQKNYMTSIHQGYEALYFNGMALGFVTENIINSQKNDWSMVIVKDAQRVTTAELSALQTYLDNGGTIFIDHKSLKYNQYGQAHNQKLHSNNGKLIQFNSDKELNNKVMVLAKQEKLLPNFTVIEQAASATNAPTTKATAKKFIAWRSAINQQGKRVALLINTSKQAVTFNLAGYNGGGLKVTNVLTGQPLNTEQQLNSMAMLFVEVAEM